MIQQMAGYGVRRAKAAMSTGRKLRATVRERPLRGNAGVRLDCLLLARIQRFPESDESRNLSGSLSLATQPFRSHFQSKTRFSCPFRSRSRGVGLRKSLINYRDDSSTYLHFTSRRYGRKSADRVSTVRAFASPSRRAGLRARTRSF